MIDTYFLSAIAAGLLLIIATAPLGCLMVWRRMVFFGDATSHAAILGIGIALILDISVWIGVLGITMLLGWGVSRLMRQSIVPDTLLAVISPSALAFGLVGVSLSGTRTVDLDAYLFGDILTVKPFEIAVIGVICVGVALATWWRWNALLTATVNRELAAVSGISARRESLFVSLAVAIVIGVSVKVIGALLISALLVIPAASARYFARTPEAMVALAAIYGAAAVLIGTTASFALDLPTGPAMICAAAVNFGATALFSRHSA